MLHFFRKGEPDLTCSEELSCEGCGGEEASEEADEGDESR